MGILRTDVVSHSQLEGSGSVEFDGVGDYLTFGSSDAFSPATSDVTIELWVYLTDGTNLSSGNYYLFDMGSNGYRIQIYNGSIYWASAPGDNDYVGPIGNVLSNNTWHHIAGVRDNNSLELYVDGVHLGSKATTASITSTSFTIGSYSTGGGDYEPYGYISNFRYVRGVVYKGPFTPPIFELKNIPGTIVLGCQSTTSATDFAVTPSTVTANGDAAASAFHPNLKKDITDTGVVFDGVTTFDSQAFMVPPSGKTTERNRGRGLLFGGYSPNPAAHVSTIQSIEIQSFGNAQDFGDLSSIRSQIGGVSSKTRAISCGGGNDSPSDYTPVNICEFVTIANSSNTTDFGDLTVARTPYKASSNDTRGIIFGGYAHPANLNVIDFITIATAGNATDFGDEIDTTRAGGSCSSTTRGIVAGGFPYINRIEFVTIATTGDAQDFGDLLNSVFGTGGVSNNTRGVFGGGGNAPNAAALNVIQFITMASTGDATDFGDLNTTEKVGNRGTSNSIRGLFCGGYDGATFVNSISAINIATTGNAVDFGDISGTLRFASAVSDSHGGLE